MFYGLKPVALPLGLSEGIDEIYIASKEIESKKAERGFLCIHGPLVAVIFRVSDTWFL